MLRLSDCSALTAYISLIASLALLLSGRLDESLNMACMGAFNTLLIPFIDQTEKEL